MYQPILLNDDMKPIAAFENAFNVIHEKELITRTSGSETLAFSLPIKDEKRLMIRNEMLVEVDNRVYVVKYIDDEKTNKGICSYECEARWYELNGGGLKTHISDSRYTARQAIEEQLEGTGWTTGVIEIADMHSFSLTEKNTVLYNIRYIQSVFGGDLEFDTKNMQVHLYQSMGKRIQKIVTYENNISKLRRLSDTRDLVTRVYGVGKDGMTVESVNNGLDYIEDYSYFDNLGLPRKLVEYVLKDERFTIPQNLLAYMQEFLNTYCNPVLCYEASVAVFEEVPEIGDYLYLIDDDFGVSKWVRILKKKEYYDNSSKNEYTFENIQEDYISQTTNHLLDTEETISQMRDSLVYQRLVSCTIYEETHEVEAMYELGNVIHYKYKENLDGGITFEFPDNTECVIRFR